MSTEIMSADEMVREALREVIDPEIGVNIVDLGMVYEVEIEGESVKITMTLTTPACPLSEYIDAAVKEALERSGVPAQAKVVVLANQGVARA